MRSITLARLAAPLWLTLPAAAEPGGEQTGGYRCRIEGVRNVSTAERLPVDEPHRFFPLQKLSPKGARLVFQETRRTGSTESVIAHVIDPVAGDYAATIKLTDHAAGEEYEIKTVGRCELAEGPDAG